MEAISSLFQERNFELKKEVRTSERAELIGYFHERIFDRAGKQYNVKRIAFLLSHVSVSDLYYMKSVCNDARHFQKMFFYLLSTKKED